MLFAAGLPRVVRDPSTDRRAAQGARSFVSRQESAGAGSRGRARCRAATRRGHIAHRRSRRTKPGAARIRRRHLIAVFVAPRRMASPRWPAPWRTKSALRAERAATLSRKACATSSHSADHARALTLVVLASKVPDVLAEAAPHPRRDLWRGVHAQSARHAGTRRFPAARISPARHSAVVSGVAPAVTPRAPAVARRGRRTRQCR